MNLQENAGLRGRVVLDRKNDGICSGIPKNHYVVGPLNLDRQNKRANTALGRELSLDEEEFAALDMLASREGEPLAFELLYRTVWDTGDGTNRRDRARLALEHLLGQVRGEGDGFMWIEHRLETGYTFRTRWSHNWKVRKR